MFDDFSLYELAKNLSLAGWVAVCIVLVVAIYLIARATEVLVSKKCFFCEKRVPKRATVCQFCDRKLT